MQVPKRDTPWPTPPLGGEDEQEWNPLDLIGGAGQKPLENFRQSMSDPNPPTHLKVVIPTNNGLSGYPPEHVIGSAFAIKALIEDADNARLSFDLYEQEDIAKDLRRQFWALDYSRATPVQRVESNGYVIYWRIIGVEGGTSILVVWSPRTATNQELTFAERYPPQPWGSFFVPDVGGQFTTWRLALANGYTWGPGGDTHYVASGDELRIIPGVPHFYYLTDEAPMARGGFYRLPITGAPNRIIPQELDVPVTINVDGSKFPDYYKEGDDGTFKVLKRGVDAFGTRYAVIDFD